MFSLVYWFLWFTGFYGFLVYYCGLSCSGTSDLCRTWTSWSWTWTTHWLGSFPMCLSILSFNSRSICSHFLYSAVSSWVSLAFRSRVSLAAWTLLSCSSTSSCFFFRSQPAAYIMLLRLFRRRRRHFQSWLMRGASPCPRWAAHHTSALLRPCKLINRAETAANWRCWPIKALGWPDEWPHLWQVWTHWRWLNFFKKWPFLKNDLF